VDLHLQIERKGEAFAALGFDLLSCASRLWAWETTSAQLSVMMNVGTMTAW